MLKICAAIFALAFAVRFSSTLRHPPAPDNTYESTQVAMSLAQRGAFADPFIVPTGPTAHLAPAFPLVLSLVYRAFGYGTAAEIAKRALNCLVSSLQYAFLPWVAVACGLERKVGFFAAWFGALVPLQRYAESAGSWESPWAAVLLMLLVVMRLRSSSSLGAMWGVALLFAPALASVYAGFLLRMTRQVRRALVLIAITVLCVCPWAFRNKLQLGSWVWLRDNFGLELSVSNQAGVSPRLSENLLTGLHNASHPHGSVAEANRVRDLGEVEYNRRRFHQALLWIRDHPGRFAELTAARATYFWFPWAGSKIQRYFLALVTMLAIFGLARRYRENRAAAQLFATIWLWFPIVYYVIEFDRRYRHPIEWTILLMATQGVFTLTAMASRPRPAA